MQVLNDWLLTPQRAAIHVPTATAVLADLHLGYDQVRRRGGEAVPVCGADEVLAALRSLAGGYEVRRLVIAGDLLEAGDGGSAVRELLAGLEEVGVALTGIVPGNHDRGLQRLDALPLCPEGITLGEWRVVHGDGRLPAGRLVHGHFHPCLRWQGGVAAPCFLIGDHRLVLPAFSADAAGVNVLGVPRWQSYRCAAIAEGEVLDLGDVNQLRRRLVVSRRAEGRQPRVPPGC